jgi:hypothetical protein
VNVAFSPLEQISAQTPLESTALAEVEGVRTVVTIETGVAGNELVEYREGNSYNRRVIAGGPFFSLSKQIAFVAGVYFFTVVQNFNLYLYTWNSVAQDWTSSPLTTSGNVASATLAATGLLITVALLNNTIEFYRWVAGSFVHQVRTLLNAGTGFNGYKIPVTAEDGAGNECTLMQRATTGQLVAACLIGAVASTVDMANLGLPTGFNPYIETAAVFLAGYFFFSYFTAAGDVRLARLDPATLAVTLLTLGAISVAAGEFPGLALLAGPSGRLFAFWAGAAIMLHPLTLQYAVLTGFPLTLVGVMVASVIGGLMFIVGRSSLALT